MDLIFAFLGFIIILGNCDFKHKSFELPVYCDHGIEAPSIVPLPKKINLIEKTTSFMVVEKELLFQVTPNTTAMIQFNIDRFIKNAFPINVPFLISNKPQLSLVHIEHSEFPPKSLTDAEYYTLRVNSTGIFINGRTTKGVIRALDTLMQLIRYCQKCQMYFIEPVEIEDEPRFPFRGFLLDSSRHFLPVEMIKEFLNMAAIAKLNVFHWHIVDNEAFPFVSARFPNLSRAGTVDPNKRYSFNDIQSIIQHASLLGIDVMPEIDTPGHTASWKGFPGFNTMCFDQYGPTDITKEKNYQFLQSLFEEVYETFKSDVVHIGGDEVSYECWESMPYIREWMAKKGFINGLQVQNYHTVKLIDILSTTWTYMLVWQEVYQTLSQKLDRKKVIINVWVDKNYNEFTQRVVKDGYQVITGSCWYLNNIDTYENWKKWYACDPQAGIDDSHAHLILGGTISMWGEKVFPENLFPRSWVRSMVPAERLWSPRNATDPNYLSARVFQLYCKLKKLGYPITDIEMSRECPFRSNFPDPQPIYL